MSTEFRPPDDPAPEPGAGSRRTDRGAARNYLARGERRRIFRLFMPPAIAAVLLLGWIERAWFPRSVRGPAPQVETTLEAVRGPRPTGDTVLIEAEPEPFDDGPANELSAPVTQLERVRDDAFFRKDEEEAWVRTWLTLRSASPRSLERGAREVGFTEMFGQPRTFRGRLVSFSGALKRLERLAAPANDYDITHYWQGWLEPAGGPASPIVVHFATVPAGMPTGMRIDEPVRVVGYFFKRYAYNARDTIRLAPLVMAREPIWKPAPPRVPGGGSLGTVALVTMAALIAATGLGLRLANRQSSPRAVPEAEGLTASLADVELFSPEESLRRLAASSDGGSGRPLEETPS